MLLQQLRPVEALANVDGVGAVAQVHVHDVLAAAADAPPTPPTTTSAPAVSGKGARGVSPDCGKGESKSNL
jgi:hypothetical protein